MSRERQLAVVTLAALTACNAVLGLDERPLRETEGTGAGGLTCDSACVSGVPAGWSGPTAVVTGEGKPSCAASLPNLELSLHDALSAAPAACVCDCAPAEGILCDASPVTVTTYDDDNCTSPQDSGSGVVGECIDLCCGGDSANYVPAIPDVSAAACAPITVADSAPLPTWGAHLTGCGPVERIPCANESCFAVPAGQSLCIYQTGDLACPDGAFSERALWYADYDDTRACDPCVCGPVVDATCNEVVEGYSNDQCVNNPSLILPTPECTTAPVDFDSAKVLSVEPSGSCAPAGGAPIGEALPTQPTTVCCLP